MQFYVKQFIRFQLSVYQKHTAEDTWELTELTISDSTEATQDGRSRSPPGLCSRGQVLNRNQRFPSVRWADWFGILLFCVPSPCWAQPRGKDDTCLFAKE